MTRAKGRRRVNACRKGKAGERALAKALRELGLPGARRTVQARGGSEAADLEGLQVRVECKVGAARYVDPIGALEQCERDGDAASDTRPRVAITRIDRAQWVVTIRARTLFVLVGMPPLPRAYQGEPPRRSVIDDEPVSIALPALVALLRAEGG